jgi:tetratricopeptide (TPR) repeat protein
MRWLLLFFLSTTVMGTEDPFLQAMQLYSQKNYADSRKILNDLVESNPSKALYWFNLGNANFMLQDYAAAERIFTKVIQLKSPLAPAAWLYRAKALKEGGSTEQAKKIFAWLARKHGTPAGLRREATRELLSDTPDDQSQTALDYYRQGQYRLALRVMKGSPADNANAQLLKALILIQLDRQDQAQMILTKLNHPLSAVLLESIRTTYSKTKWLYLESNVGYDSNIRKAEEAEQGTSLFANAGIGARLWAKDLWLINAGYDGRWYETFGSPELRV